MNNIYLLIPDNDTRDSLALATVVETKGSTPQKHGSSALFGEAGLLAGTVGGGVLEGKVQQLAQQLIHAGESGIYDFYLDKEITSKQDAICGGQATVLIDASPLDHNNTFRQIKESVQKSVPGVLITSVYGDGETGKKISRFWVTSGNVKILPRSLSDLLTDDVEKLLSSSDPGAYKKLDLFLPGEQKNVMVLMEPLFPPKQLVIAGAGHIGKALAHLGKFVGFEVTVIDDREEFANKANIPDADHLLVKDVGVALQELRKNNDTYIVIVTRGHDDDAKALRSCIDSGSAYVGMIGSRNKIAKMRKNFLDNGWANEQQWSRVHAPVGIDILSKTVEEIAVSIVAELVFERNKGKKI